MKLASALAGAAALLTSATLALADGHATFNPAVIYDLGGKFDRSSTASGLIGCPAVKWARD